MSWCSDFADICRADVPLRDFTWYRLGGPARWFVTPQDADQLAAVLRSLETEQVPWRILGRGANLLVRDEGFDGAVLRLTGPYWESVEYFEDHLRAAAGADFPRLVKATAERGLAGLEGLAGIPGSVGGVVRMNAGGKHGCIADVCRTVDVARLDGTRGTLTAAEVGFDYRHTRLGGCVVTGAVFNVRAGDANELVAKFRKIWTEKYESQPPLSVPSAGCIFKNPPGQSAGRIIDELGLKGTRCGQAEVSARHANFIVANPGATARDVLQLIELVRDRVRRERNLELQPEIEIW